VHCIARCFPATARPLCWNDIVTYWQQKKKLSINKKKQIDFGSSVKAAMGCHSLLTGSECGWMELVELERMVQRNE